MGMVATLVMWKKYFVQILANLANGVFTWNLSSIGPIVCEKTYVLIYWWDSNMRDLAERSKVNLDLWNLFIAIVS